MKARLADSVFTAFLAMRDHCEASAVLEVCRYCRKLCHSGSFAKMDVDIAVLLESCAPFEQGEVRCTGVGLITRELALTGEVEVKSLVLFTYIAGVAVGLRLSGRLMICSAYSELRSG